MKKDKSKEIARTAEDAKRIERTLHFHRSTLFKFVDLMNNTDSAEELESLCQWSKIRIDAIRELNSQRVAGKEIAP